MKKLGKSTKKGFTLVELIVVLVILAVLAAMLVPALVGYIDKAKAEKEYQTASTVYAAAQAVITEAYGKNDIKTVTGTAATITATGFTGCLNNGMTADSAKNKAYGAEVCDLAGVTYDATNGPVKGFSFNVGEDYVISGGTVNIGDSTYTLTITNGTPSWTAAKTTTTP